MSVLAKYAVKHKKRTKRILFLRESHIDFVADDESPDLKSQVKLDSLVQATPSLSNPAGVILHVKNHKGKIVMEEHHCYSTTDRQHLLFDLQRAILAHHPSEPIEFSVEVSTNNESFKEDTLKFHGPSASITNEPLPLSFLISIKLSSADKNKLILTFASGKSLLFKAEQSETIAQHCRDICISQLGLTPDYETIDTDLVIPKVEIAGDSIVLALNAGKPNFHTFNIPDDVSDDVMDQNSRAFLISPTHLVECSPDSSEKGLVTAVFEYAETVLHHTIGCYSYASIVSICQRKVGNNVLVTIQRSCDAPISIITSPDSADAFTSTICYFHCLGSSLLRYSPWKKNSRICSLPLPSLESPLMFSPPEQDLMKNFEEPLFRPFFGLIMSLPQLDKDNSGEIESLFGRIDHQLTLLDAFTFDSCRTKSHKGAVSKVFTLIDWLLSVSDTFPGTFDHLLPQMLVKTLSISSFLFSLDSAPKDITEAHVETLMKLLQSTSLLVRVFSADLILGRLFLLEKGKVNETKRIGKIFLEQGVLDLFSNVIRSGSASALVISGLIDIALTIRKVIPNAKKERQNLELIQNTISVIPNYFSLLTHVSVNVVHTTTQMLVFLISSYPDLLTEAKRYSLLSVGYLSILKNLILYSPIPKLNSDLVHLAQTITLNNVQAFTVLMKTVPPAFIATLIQNGTVPPSPSRIFEIIYNPPAPINLDWNKLVEVLSGYFAAPTLIINPVVKSELIDRLSAEINGFYTATRDISDDVELIWNSKDYYLELSSLESNVQVSGFYLSTIKSTDLDLSLDIIQKLLTESFHKLCLVELNSENAIVIISAMTVLMKIAVEKSSKSGSYTTKLPEIKYLIPHLTKAEGGYLIELIQFFEISTLIPNNLSAFTVSIDGVTALLDCMYELLISNTLPDSSYSLTKTIQQLCKVNSTDSTNKVVFYPPSPAFRSILKLTNLSRIVALFSVSDSRIVDLTFEIISNIVTAGISSSDALIKSGLVEFLLFNMFQDEHRTSAVVTLSQVCSLLTKHLNIYLPLKLIKSLNLVKNSSADVLDEQISNYFELFNSDTDTASLVWSDSTRSHLLKYLNTRVEQYSFLNKGCTDYVSPTDFEYPSFKKEVIINGIFLRNLVKCSKFVDSGIEDAHGLFEAIIEYIETNPKLSDDQYCWIVITIKMIVEEFGRPDKNGLFSSISNSIMKFLVSFLSINSNGSLAHPNLVSPSIDTIKSIILIDFVDPSKSTQQNILNFIQEGGVSSLCKLLSYYTTNLSNPLSGEVIHCIADIVTQSIIQSKSSVSDSLSDDSLSPLVASLSQLFSNIPKEESLFKDIVKLVVKLCSYNELSSHIYQFGLPLRMIRFILDPSSPSQLKESVAEGLLEFAKFPVGVELFKSLFTCHFASLLAKTPTAEFCSMLTTETMNPLVYWNSETRSELMTFLDSQLKNIEEGKDFTTKIDYEAHIAELRIGEVFCRLFNKDPSFTIPKPAEFITELLAMVNTVLNGTLQSTIKSRQLSLLLRTFYNFIKHQHQSAIPSVVRKSSTIEVVLECCSVGDQDLSEYCLKLISALIEISESLTEFEQISPNSWLLLLKLATTDVPTLYESALLTIDLFVTKSTTIASVLLKNSLLFVVALHLFGQTKVVGSSASQTKAAGILASLLKDSQLSEEVKPEITKIVPETIISALLERKPSAFQNFYNQDHYSPTIIFTAPCREQLANYLVDLHREWIADGRKEIVLFDRVQYDELDKYICICGIYLENYVKEDEYPIKNSNFFCDSIIFYIEKNRVKLSNADEEIKEKFHDNLLTAMSALQKLFSSTQSAAQFFAKDVHKVEVLKAFISADHTEDFIKKAISLLTLVASGLSKKSAEPLAITIAQQVDQLDSFTDSLLTLAIKVIGCDVNTVSRLFIEHDLVKKIQRMLVVGEIPTSTQQKCRSLIDTLKSGNETVVLQQIALVEDELASEAKEAEDPEEVDQPLEENPDDVEISRSLAQISTPQVEGGEEEV
ncbi:hypothetical protein P9112_008745 [Eukaryota sp. TZLM1-RC]